MGERSQHVQVEEKVSSSLQCDDLGAPEGTVLAGLIHLIYCNDQPACHAMNESASSIVFVDDDTENVHAPDMVSLKTIFQNEVNKAVEWLSDNVCVLPLIRVR